MRSAVFPPFLALAALVAFVSKCGAAAAPASYDTDVRPLLRAYCFNCHNASKHKGDVDLARFGDVPSIQREPKLWRNVLTQLNDRNMPPENKPQPTAEERTRLVEWVQYTLTHFDASHFAKDPGRPTIRRLNRFEYNNTVQDLFKIVTKPADAFPADAGGGAGFDNNADTLFIPPILMEQYLAAADAVLKEAKDGVILIAKPEGALSKRDSARKVLEHFAFRAFRRPVATTEIDAFLKLFDAADARGDEYRDSVRLALKGVLVSPHFLFRVESDRETGRREPWEVDDFELASRLSYFLWSTLPDDELFLYAGLGILHEPHVLDAQVSRMLKDPRSKALAESFGTQWLGVRELLTNVNPDPNRFPTFNAQLRFAMYDEAVAVVDSVFRDDAPLTTLLDADYTFVNDPLAEHYGVDRRRGGRDAEGELMRRVKLTDRRRGGVLGLGAVLTVTSYPLRTSPVLRGKWVLEQLLGDAPPPPPPGTPELPKDDAKKDGLSFRKQLELHRSNAACASCHARMDPLGFGLENFDAVGRWRTELGGEPVDASGVMPGGKSFAGPAELKQVLLSRKDEFVRTLAEKMLGYALGRGLEYYDQPTVQEICDALERDGHKSSTLIREIVKSYPFRYRRNALPEETKQRANASTGSGGDGSED